MGLHRLGSAVPLLLLVAVIAGCSGQAGQGKGPETVPVRGKVVFTKGGDVKTLVDRQARIEFESVDQPGIRAAGMLEEGGSFSVATVTEAGSSLGAVPGTHRVRFLLDERDERFLAPQFMDFQKSGITVKLPSAEPIEIKVWR